ncbi:MAG: hypothetical protein P1U32_09105 [Legionellaceae bacterium]|nr:hypothetical protein [Legionellaceae bacterium]
MFQLYTKKQRVHPLSLSEAIDSAWATFTDRLESVHAKKKALGYLKKTFCLSSRQPDADAIEKLSFLMTLKKNSTIPEYIPSIADLEPDTDHLLLRQKERIEKHCVKLIHDIITLIFEADDDKAEKYFQNKRRRMQQLETVDMLESFELELLSILSAAQSRAQLKC